jgi:threonine dehydratase
MPVGSGVGGLVASVTLYVKRIAPVFGVGTYGVNAMMEALKNGGMVTLKDVSLFVNCAIMKEVCEAAIAKWVKLSKYLWMRDVQKLYLFV